MEAPALCSLGLDNIILHSIVALSGSSWMKDQEVGFYFICHILGEGLSKKVLISRNLKKLITTHPVLMLLEN